MRSSFAYILLLVLSFHNLDSFVKSSAVERCREQRVRDNENSLNSWQSSSRGVDGASMTRRSLKAINRTTFESLDKPRTAILDLSVNKISKIQNGTFEGFRNLRILTMQINNLHRIDAPTFNGLMMLEELDLSRNMISDVDRDAFRHMMSLHTIDLSHNCMLQLPNYLFFRNVRLINVYLKRNHLVSLPILMPTQQFIENFNVSGNALTNMTSLKPYNNIQSLDLSDNPLSPDEMADVAKEDDASSDDSENYNYLNIRFDTDTKYTHNPSPSSSSTISPTQARRRQSSGRYGNRDRIDFSTDVNFMATSRRARATFTESFDYNSDVEYLMDTFRPVRMSAEALESLIKTTMETMSEDFKVTDMVRVMTTISEFYWSQDRIQLQVEVEEINRSFDLASFLRYLRKTLTTRRTRNTSSKQSRYTPEQLQQLIAATRTNHMEYFTCRHCSLKSLAFLVNFPELKYVDVSGNGIKTVNVGELGRAMPNMRYLLISDNEIESLNLTAMLSSWPDFRALIANGNPTLNCDLIAEMHYQVEHLNKIFKLEVNKCK